MILSTVFAEVDANLEIVKKIGSIISTKYYSTEYSDDLIGVEVCAATKNIYSMLIGASEGLSSEVLSDEIKNKYYFTNLNDLVGSWRLLKDGKTVKEGIIPTINLAPSSSKEITLDIPKLKSTSSEYTLNFSYRFG